MDPVLGQRIEAACLELENIPLINSGGCGLVAWAFADALIQLGHHAVIRTVDGGYGIHPAEVKEAMGGSIAGNNLPDLYETVEAAFYHCVVQVGDVIFDTASGLRDEDNSHWACYGPLTNGHYEADEFRFAACSSAGWNGIFRHRYYKPRICEIIGRHLGVTVTPDSGVLT